MTRIPKQFVIYVLVLLLYFWPWQFFSGDRPEDWLLTVLTLQIAFVIICDGIVKEDWILAIILIEAFCMLINMTMFLFSSLIAAIHGHIVFVAAIIELLIITISLKGAVVERTNSNRVPMARNRVWTARRGVLPVADSQKGVS